MVQDEKTGYFGYMGRILRVNLSTGKITTKEIPIEPTTKIVILNENFKVKCVYLPVDSVVSNADTGGT